MKEILRFEKIHYRYDGEREALKNVSVGLFENEKVAVLGNNGAGKSTFFLCCNGILKPQSGHVYFRGQEIKFSKKESLKLRQAVGLVFQDPDNQIIAGTVEAEISFGPMNLRLPKEEVRSRVDDAIEKFRLEPMRFRAPHYLSGGEKKRVSIADVLVMNPHMILMDEPTASLDPENTKLLEDNLQILSDRGLGIVISTHDVDFAWRWADRILVFNDGQLVADSSPEAIFSDEVLLLKCGLIQPTLFQVGKLLDMRPLPKTIEEVKRFQKLKAND